MSSLSKDISMKFGRNIDHTSKHCPEKLLRSESSKVKVMTIPTGIIADACMAAVWRHHHHHHHRVARPWQDIAVSMSLRHLERSCARFHAVRRRRPIIRTIAYCVVF